MGRRVSVNGRPVFKVIPFAEGGVNRAEIAGLLHLGTNEVVVAGEYNSGYGIPARALSFVELFTVAQDGTTRCMGPDASWEWRYSGGEGPWRKAKTAGSVGTERIANGTLVAQRGGYIPLHAGPLAVSPDTEDGYPLFEEGEPAKWKVAVFGRIGKANVVAEVSDAATGRTVLRKSTPADCASVALEGLRGGAYEVRWTLERDGQPIDADRRELVVLGPIAQDEFAYADFEAELDRRLELLQEIDCTKDDPNPTNFLDHAGSESRPVLNVGGVEAIGPYRARVTGPRRRDFFAYRIAVAALGEPHIVEIEFPDVDDRVACTSVDVTFPNDYAHNVMPGGCTAWPVATGSVRTGGILPTSGGLKTMRTVFFPGSSNATYSVENGRNGPGAAVTRIRVYRVKGGLPALRLPKTERTYANHCERPLFHQWGTQFNPRLSDYARGDFERSWAAAYAAAANRVRYLRYAGHNAAVEGVYMYRELFPTESGESLNTDRSFNFFWLAARLYARNGIRLFPCFEYVRAPRLALSPRCGVSNREIAAGTARGLYHVDATGRQRASYANSGLNFQVPEVWASVTNLVREIYLRYNALPNVEGLFAVSGMWWLPGYPYTGKYDVDDVGFDDDSIEAFERETGIRLGTGTTGAVRFSRRKELLHGKYSREWHAWRSENLKRHLEEIAGLLKGGRHDWALYSVPHVHYPEANPFVRIGATKSERDGYQAERLRRAGFDPALYGRNSASRVRLVPEVNYLHCLDVARYGGILSDGTKRIYEELDAAYLSCIGLDEHFNRNSTGATAWWWKANGVSAFDVKPSGRDAFYDFVDILSGTTPRNLFHTWLDVNLTTAHTEEARRFVTGFLATPCTELKSVDTVRGVTARAADGAMQLVNATPYPVEGVLRIRGRVEDAITGRTFADGEVAYRLEAWGVTVLKGEDASRIAGTFGFSADDARKVRAEADFVLGAPALARAIDAETLARLSGARRAEDDYATARILRNVEILEPTMRYRAAETALGAQRRFDELLKRDGVVRIDCGSAKETTDELGRTWLPDQKLTGFGTYGNQFGRFADRGRIGIAKTRIPSIYRTECGGGSDLHYTFPVPPGRYDVVLHFAETWNNAPGRELFADVNGDRREIKVWERSGWKNAATFETYSDVKAESGRIEVAITGQPIVNGIEIQRSGE